MEVEGVMRERGSNEEGEVEVWKYAQGRLLSGLQFVHKPLRAIRGVIA